MFSSSDTQHTVCNSLYLFEIEILTLILSTPSGHYALSQYLELQAGY